MNVVDGLSGGAALEELMKMVRDLQIAQTRSDGGGQLRNWRLLNDLRCMWCDAVGHIWRNCADFVEALKNNVVYT